MDVAMDAAALTLRQATQLLLACGVLGVAAYLLLLASFALLPTIRAQHPAAALVAWQAGCGLMTSLGFVAAFFVQMNTDERDADAIRKQCAVLGPYNQFFMSASCAWYLMLTLDLLVALVNPWMGYSCKSWAYHTIVWSLSAASALAVYQLRLYGLSELKVCWIERTALPEQINTPRWVFLFGLVLLTCALSLSVLLFASFRFVRRQLDVTYRTKRRNLIQYYRYLFVFAAYWAACGALYYASYHERFRGRLARNSELALVAVFGSAYPVLLLVVWALNTELYQNLSGDNSLPKSARGSGYGEAANTEHFSAALRKDLMRYTTAGIRVSLNEAPPDSLRSPLLAQGMPIGAPLERGALASRSFLQLEEGESSVLYSEKKRLATTVYNGEFRYYEKLGFTDYAPQIFRNIREVCGIENDRYEQSFADTLLERASEGKSGSLFYFTSDRKYLVKTMTKKEHSFLLDVLPLFHQYILKQPNTLLCRFLGCHSMQLPVGWNKMFFVVMENVFSDGPVDERYDLKGIFHQTGFTYHDGVATPRSSDWRDHQCMSEAADPSDEDEDEEVEDEEKQEETSDASNSTELESALSIELKRLTEQQPLLRRGSSRASLRYEMDFVSRRASLRVTPTTRANLLAQVTSDCGFLQELNIMDYSFLLGVRHFPARVAPDVLDRLAHNAVASANMTTVYYLGFVDILQYYSLGWQMQHCLLASLLDKRRITALPPAEYALRFLNFIHEYLLRDQDSSNIRSYGSVGYTPRSGAARWQE